MEAVNGDALLSSLALTEASLAVRKGVLTGEIIEIVEPAQALEMPESLQVVLAGNEPASGSAIEPEAAAEDRPPPPVQERLFAFENPLDTRFGKAFFKEIPRAPGVYRMLGVDGILLYVGKAKDLRTRLQSYRRAQPGQVSRKVIRMIHQIRSIEWELCESETAALLRENELLRQHKPPFNSVNTHPESYYFIGIRDLGGKVRFRLTLNAKRQGDLLFGAFKGGARSGYTALLRLLWVIPNLSARFEYPTLLTRRQPAALYTVELEPKWLPLLKRFLHGTSEELLAQITERLLELDHLPRFAYHLIQTDLDTVRDFYARGPRRNWDLRLQHRLRTGLRRRIIGQNELDDLLVLSWSEKAQKAAKLRTG